MTPAQQVKAAGLYDLPELSEMCHVPVATLRTWHKTQPERFAFLCRAGWLVKVDKIIKGDL